MSAEIFGCSKQEGSTPESEQAGSPQLAERSASTARRELCKKTATLKVRIDPDTLALLKERCLEIGQSLSCVVRTLLAREFAGVDFGNLEATASSGAGGGTSCTSAATADLMAGALATAVATNPAYV